MQTDNAIKSPKVKFAVVGLGRIGQRHIDKINQLPQAELKAVCDSDNLASIQTTNNVKKFNNLSDLLHEKDMCDVVSICTPNGMHSDMAIQALNLQKHVVCEKPMALSSRDCKAMISAALKNNRKLFVVKQNRYNRPVIKVKELIESNALGRIFMIVVNCFWNRNEEYFNSSKWKGSKNIDGGPLFTQFDHFIDLIYWFAGDVLSVQALGRNFNHPSIEFEDSGIVQLEFVNGAIGSINYTISTYNKNMEGSITVFAEKGTVKIGGQYLNELEYQNCLDGIIDNRSNVGHNKNYGLYQGSMSNHLAVYKNILAVINEQEAIEVDGIDGLKAIEIIEAINKSTKSGQKELVN